MKAAGFQDGLKGVQIFQIQPRLLPIYVNFIFDDYEFDKIDGCWLHAIIAHGAAVFKLNFRPLAGGEPCGLPRHVRTVRGALSLRRFDPQRHGAGQGAICHSIPSKPAGG
ncbi:hypothetical protein SDC9_143696 [bioreactor metagenome]|uniref:Uncharacterized protein n=1 Tax=bioreactor metagenome TaxID=1076179 RepID=A0A645E7E9_9ZZZZ